MQLNAAAGDPPVFCGLNEADRDNREADRDSREAGRDNSEADRDSQ